MNFNTCAEQMYLKLEIFINFVSALKQYQPFKLKASICLNKMYLDN